MRTWEVVARLGADKHKESGLAREDNGTRGLHGDIYIKFPETGCMWVRQSGRYVTGWTYYGDYFAAHFTGFIDRLRIRKAVRAWLARQGTAP